MVIRYLIGVDISKATAPAARVCWAVFDGKIVVLQSQSANSETGIKTTIKLLRSLPSFKMTESVYCMEHTARAAPRNLQHILAESLTQNIFTHLVGKQSPN